MRAFVFVTDKVFQCNKNIYLKVDMYLQQYTVVN